MKKLITILGLASLCGCASYQSVFEVGGNKFVMPKDAVFSYLQITIPSSNGPISLVVSNGSFKMNPAVLDAKTAHDVAVINATQQALQAAMNSARP